MQPEETPTQGHPEHDDEQLVRAVKEFMTLLDAGSAPSLEQFLQSHAAIAADLRPALEGLAMVHGAAGRTKGQALAFQSDAELQSKPIGDFQIVGELGRGGMGIVYEAIQLSLGRRVALKVLPFASGLDASRLQRFRNEAHAAAQLHHTNIVPVHAVGSDRGVQYYAMQLIEGHTLAQLVESMRQANSKSNIRDVSTTVAITPTEGDSLGSHTNTPKVQSTLLNSGNQRRQYFRSVVRMIYQATQALEHAHQYGVVHRDIKPGNLLLDTAGKLWVTDFGLAQIEHGEAQLTRSGDALGTVRYMSPEQAAGNRLILDHRTDIYSLGVTLYELLTLEPAIRGNDYRDMLNQVAEREPLAPKLLDPALPTELDTIVRKAIAKDPVQRYATAAAFGDDLLAWLDDKPIAAQPPTRWERLGKWRKRNHHLVNGAAALLVLASFGLLVTTLVVLREQQQTRLALDAETRQRAAAERNFQQARRAVDTFSELSETELAYRPEFQSLRRLILETSLEFYRDFLAQRAGDFAESQELRAASEKVERMVAELRLLDNVAPLLLLADRRVRQELGIDEQLQTQFLTQIAELQSARENLGDENGLLLIGSDTPIAIRLREFVASLTGEIDDNQMNRLRQIFRQQQLPFTFLNTDVGEALQLSSEQRQQISRIIQEERPDRRGPPGGGPRRGGGPGNGPDFAFGPGPGFGPGGPPSSGFHGQGPPPRGPDHIGPDRMGTTNRGSSPNAPSAADGQRPWDRQDMQATTARTVRRIVAILTPEQRVKWSELVGEPFDLNFRWNPGNPPPR